MAAQFKNDAVAIAEPRSDVLKAFLRDAERGLPLFRGTSVRNDART